MTEQDTVSKKKQKKKILTLLSRDERQEILLKFFKKHIGVAKEASQKQIFSTLYGDPENYNELQLFYLWHQIRLDMNWLRKTTYCFVASRHTSKGRMYFVVKSWHDADFYLTMMANTKKKIDYMMKRCRKAVDEKFAEKFARG